MTRENAAAEEGRARLIHTHTCTHTPNPQTPRYHWVIPYENAQEAAELEHHMCGRCHGL